MRRRPLELADEIKQVRGFRNKATEAALALMRTETILRRKAEAIVATEDLSLQQYNVLRILRGARAPLPTMEIAARLVEPSPGVTRFVNSLESRNLIRREQWPGDRRQVLCQITPAGLKVLEKLDPAIDDFDGNSMGPLTDEQLETLLDLLAEIRAANAASQ